MTLRGILFILKTKYNFILNAKNTQRIYKTLCIFSSAKALCSVRNSSLRALLSANAATNEKYIHLPIKIFANIALK